ncbi:DUF5615 family PIN-like protein [Argonema galeatum]|uniref:DUF5615 family PIN-like protein n=1 Tax=Argonema galeatum TaxID=2942762 RepID=UPI002011AD3E|nr:DUF5615 family PIN-like protein [Argonema galeatum]MCL1465078.1 DUF5615 family PIN-like protein [Argonema galeatum A003/A1]
MSQIRLYLDEDTLRGALVQALQNAGVDLVTTADANNLGQIDSEQLIWATEQQRVIYTFNVGDFCRLHKTYMEEDRVHTGIIIAERQSYAVGEQLRGIQRLISTKSAEEMINQLVFLGAYVRE